MEARTLSLSGRSVRYLAGTTSWHPTFEVLFLVGDRNSLTPFQNIARSLISYANVYVLERSELLGNDRSVAGTDALLGWTKATRVRRPVMAAAPAELRLLLDFARGFPQFTLGVVALPQPAVSDRSGVIAGAGRLLRSLLSLPASLLNPTPEAPIEGAEARLATLAVPYIDLSAAMDEDRIGAEIRRFAASIRPRSPALERRPRRPWESPS